MTILKPLSPEAIGQEYKKELSVQDYSKKTVIDGVQIINLPMFYDDGGSLAEIVRLDENGCLQILPEFKVRQTTYSQMLPGTIKAFHLHYNQEDVWFVMPYDRLLIGLFDARKESPTYNQSMRFVLGSGRAQALYIPRGVAHGLANVFQNPANMIYFVNQCFDANEPDERRLPWDILGEDFWTIKKG
ncbi:MAG: dTDP-4-dehydrorhamnose 3,5-epimerase family protein [Candidatus Melainabacteria bacterium]|jgi:dTDP-4-dehydrorhamnose 3,5-epimerase|nr:dTDP-4-dehydrorhamnose 3,5-epimerase family protein [Candidatus Melainabacteria bacterium]